MAALSWNGFRSYFDQPWFVARLSRSSRTAFPADLQTAIYEGNFEACLDEHFWLDDSDHANWFKEKRRAGRLDALQRSLSIRAAPVVFQRPGAEGEQTVRLAAHAALPLTDTAIDVSPETGKEKLRADHLRHAFNTPFWPHLLCTTSVGQEGLDFHQWCQTVVHWDLPNGPIEFEQREGRVDRFKSLAVRRAIVRKANEQAADLFLWDDLGTLAANYADESGLRPWWVMDDATIRRIFMDAPSSEERARRKELVRLRDLYRLVLGMPNQWQLLARLAASNLDVDTARRACLQLAAWKNDKGGPAKRLGV